jgi:predicted N-acetyltransferase YhbS
MNLTFRPETPADRYEVESLTREAFWEFWETDGRVICDEHLLVHRMRDASVFVPELNIVAELDGKITGHIMYARSKVTDDHGTEHETLTFGPLSVRPEMQKKGIGQALMRHSFDIARRLGYRAVIIYGHPEYYPRVGFRQASGFGITDPDGKSFDYIMALPLYNGALDGISGRYRTDPVYENLAQEDVLEFDKRFPYKEPFVLDCTKNLHLPPET